MDPLQAKANFNRICQLLIDKGSDALRRALHVVHPAPTLAAALHSHRKTLQKLRHNVINPPQWRLLYPAAGPPDSNDFDITLLTILLRNICGLSSPASGWNAMPPSTDTSISADILRIKIFRNEVYGHTTSAQYDDATFEKLWQEISQPLVELGIPQHEINELKVAPLSPEEKSHVEKLMEWKELEDTLLEKIKDFERQMVDVKAEVQKLKGTLSSLNISNVDQLTKFDFKGKIDGLCEKFQEDTRQWFFDELSTWFADKESRVMILTAGPGIGKSVLSAKVCQEYRRRCKLAGRHFCDFRKSNYSKPSNILQSLASQICDNVDGFRETLTEILGRNHSLDSLSDAFTVLLSEPLHALDRREPMLIVMDALDESETDGKSELLELISDEFPDLPKWIKILITSRPELQVKKKLERFKPLEVLPQDYNQLEDLKCFVKGSLPHFKVDRIVYLVRKCEGSFLYAYHMVKELKEMDAGVEPNLSGYAPKGISAFYERQFLRLRTGLQQHDPGSLQALVNVVGASSGKPLPLKILLKCMNLSDEKYEIRNTIFNIMSEILPVYNNCLTVYHKSLTDWLTLEGYEEHAFVADVDDGAKRLWEVCEGIYRDIDSVKSVSDFEMSSERKFALENGGEYLVNVGDTVDFHWLANIRLNALKFHFCGGLNVDYCRMLNNYKSALSEDLYWSLVQHYSISDMIATCDVGLHANCKKIMYCMYLQSLANTHFDLIKRCTSFQNAARDILNETNQVWLEEVVNVENSDYEVISNAVFVLPLRSPEVNSYVNSVLKCVTVSPDQFYVACCYDGVLMIKNIDNGKTMQTVELQHPPEACWWSELCLWVVCKGVIVKFPFDSGHPKGLGSGINEFTLNFDCILQFEKDVLVIEAGGILIVKIFENKLIISPQIPHSIFCVSSSAISPDGCAVLLCNYRSEYQLWEFARENGWELHLFTRFPNLDIVQVHWLSLTGTRNSRRCMYLTYDSNGSPRFDLSLNFIDLSNGSWPKCLLNSVGYAIRQVYYAAPNFLLIYWSRWVHVYNVSDGKTIAVLYFGNVCETLHDAPSFYLSTRGLLLFVLKNDIKCFRINNIDNCLES